jgi:hypothetical protein
MTGRHTREPRLGPEGGVSEPSLMVHGHMLLRARPEKHKGSPEVPVMPRRSWFPFRAGARFQKGRRRLRVPLDWRKTHSRTPYPSAKPTIRLIAISSIAISARGRDENSAQANAKNSRAGSLGTPVECLREVILYEGPLGKRGPCVRVPFGPTWIADARLGRTTAQGRETRRT